MTESPSFPPLLTGLSAADPMAEAIALAREGCDGGTLLHAVQADRLRAAIVFAPEVPLARVRPVDRIREVRCPTLVIHGVDDPLIPLETGRALWQASGAEEKGWVRVEAGTHGNVLVTPQPIYVEMGAWFLRALTEKE